MPDVQHSALTGAEQHEPKGVDSASVDTQYISGGAGSGTWKKAEADNVTVADSGDFFTGTEVEAVLQELGPAIARITPKYGDMHLIANSTATTISSSDTYVKVVAGWNSDHVDGITFSTDELTLDSGSDGLFLVECSLSFTGQTNETFRFEFHKDVGAGDVPFEEGAVSRKTQSADVGSVALQSVVSLDATHSISLYVKNTGATGNPTITDAHLFMYRIKAE